MKTLHSAHQNLRSFQTAVFTLLLLFSHPTFAAGGLPQATTFLSEITSWAYGFLGTATLLYCIYLVVMALLEKKQWGDVFIGMGKTAAAGGVIVAATYMWSIWGS
ncbi:conjugal transfer protein [Vibrio mediterranei]|uniref:Conjugal transfer protein n=1 Tax=Vibrio mediterranei TaxID=689 RepID=A0ABX5DDY4_9VIBR|nr:conjugal transfer protein [Vibrio mediterranei]PCD85637.1 conjugal transfer protein [Vibrio mediterranei]PRQ66516.1 conjugal transfer protein [Vibrio mediterranei]